LLTSLQAAEFNLTCRQVGGCSFEAVAFYESVVDSANRRFLQAVKMLATVRKLALPGPAVLVDVKQSTTVKVKRVRPRKKPGPTLAEMMKARSN